MGKTAELKDIFERFEAPFLLVNTVEKGIIKRQTKRIRLESKFTSR